MQRIPAVWMGSEPPDGGAIPMTTTSRTHKHRATTPVPVTERPSSSGAHRASRVPEMAVTAVLGAGLVALLVVLLTRG